MTAPVLGPARAARTGPGFAPPDEPRRGRGGSETLLNLEVVRMQEEEPALRQTEEQKQRHLPARVAQVPLAERQESRPARGGIAAEAERADQPKDQRQR